uniref:GNAT family N-acetyltransferase n=1 Tax=Vaginimicrobium propionicum TaxID=1871034 RepID=UPI000970B2D3|nr:GNAT family N-acetyltransferase [Vaginimicrobium propionicum]
MSPSWAEAFVEPSLDWKFVTFEDLEDIAELRLAIEYMDDPTERRTLSDMRAEYTEDHAQPNKHAVVGRDKGGTIVAYAWNHPSLTAGVNPHVWMEIGVHPAWRHRRIGLHLVKWSIERARMWWRSIHAKDPLIVEMAVDESSSLENDLRINGELKPQRWFFDMHRELDEPLTSCPTPSGIVIKKYSSQYCEQVRIAHNLAFSTRAGAHGIDEAQWDKQMRRSEFRPEWSWLALDSDSGEVVGYVLNSQLDSDGIKEGWTDRIGVIPAWRDKGVASCLLCAAIESFVTSGCLQAGIGVDTDKPVTQLFNSLGFKSDDRVVLYQARYVD